MLHDKNLISVLFSWLKPDEQQSEDELAPLPDVCVNDDPDLLGAEQKRVGGLAWGVYRTYWFAMGGILAAAILMSLLLMQGLEDQKRLAALTLNAYLLENNQEKI